MLLGQQLRGRHQRRLVARLGHRHRRQEGHHRLPAAHVAFEQAVHGMRPGQVGTDLVPGAHLGSRQLEGQIPQRRVGARAVLPDGDARGVRPARPAQRQPQLQQVELFEDQALVMPR